MRWRYLPLLMIYFAYGALGLVDRGAYGHQPEPVIAAVTIGFVVPLAGILAFGRRAT